MFINRKPGQKFCSNCYVVSDTKLPCYCWICEIIGIITGVSTLILVAIITIMDARGKGNETWTMLWIATLLALICCLTYYYVNRRHEIGTHQLPSLENGIQMQNSRLFEGVM
ncbi:hypothetical protein FGO68_gene7399 [Halteria grandinella]|uniref:Uncharacterized protein n=1 Tax=Halteria grandinella TaxID=5974 RepID=A0A8J8NHP4_HALGN|nr:hypothetical protein FGO68_gene7399 [Halteria grandinella]